MNAALPVIDFQTSKDLQVTQLHKALAPYRPRFADVLAGTGMNPDRLFATFMFQVERNPRLLDCTANSLMGSFTTFGTLALECDGATGQGYILPFKHSRSNSTRAQPLVGYKGYNTLGWRNGLTINGGLWLEGDDLFEFQEGTSGFVHHRRKLGGESDRRILAAWATATAPGRAPIVKVLSIDELEAVKKKAPGSKDTESPWNDLTIGRRAMYEKTGKRRLARNLPISAFVLAAAVEEQHEELGHSAFLDVHATGPKMIVEGEVVPIAHTPDPQQRATPASSPMPTGQPQPDPEERAEAFSTKRPTFPIRKGQGRDKVFQCASVAEWRAKMLSAIGEIKTADRVEDFYELNEAIISDMSDVDRASVREVMARFSERLGRQL